jgi:predicted RNA-binding Zn ribbon-like protein
MARYDLPRAAEGPLRVVQLFVNSVDKEHGREWWPRPADLESWLAERGLAANGVDVADLERARELREAFRNLLRANNVGGETGDAARVVNRMAVRGGVTLALDHRSEIGVEVHGTGFDGALGGIVAVAFRAMLDGSWGRLKACRQCGWAFYDTSKNRSGSWCSMQLCGNRTKTRAYRRRKSAGGRA